MENEDTMSSAPEDSQSAELSHSDKIAGVIIEPARTFEITSRFPTRTIDWFLPIALILVAVIISQIILWSNPEIKYKMEVKQRETLQESVAAGTITQEQVDKQIEFMSGSIGHVIRSVSILIFGFVFFFLVTAIYFVFSKFVLKGEGNYASALVANGLTSYIAILGVILVTALSIVMGRMLQDVSLASLLHMDGSSFLGWLLSFINVFSIWVYAVLSIGLAKMFKAQSTAKYFVMVFGLWFLWRLIVFGLGETVPLLKNF